MKTRITSKYPLPVNMPLKHINTLSDIYDWDIPIEQVNGQPRAYVLLMDIETDDTEVENKK